MRLRAVLAMICQVGLIVGQSAWAFPAGEVVDQRELVIRRVGRELGVNGGVGRLYYGSPTCPANGNDVPFPDVDLSTTDANLDELGGAFGERVRVETRRESNGLFRIKFGEMPENILAARIPYLRIRPEDRYDPAMVIMAIEGEEHVDAQARRIGVQDVFSVMDMIVQGPAKGRRHFDASIRNLTVDQAFDLVAKRFGGMVVFGACGQHGLYRIDFVPL